MTTETKTDALTAAILTASEALDPSHQGAHWPDPIAWDGRPLAEQARDLLALTNTQPAAATALRAALAL